MTSPHETLIAALRRQLGDKKVYDPDALRRTAIDALIAVTDDGQRHLLARIRHLETRCYSQRRTIASLIADRRVVKGRRGGWMEGREALLKQQLAQERGRVEAMTKELDQAKAVIDAFHNEALQRAFLEPS